MLIKSLIFISYDEYAKDTQIQICVLTVSLVWIHPYCYPYITRRMSLTPNVHRF